MRSTLLLVEEKLTTDAVRQVATGDALAVLVAGYHPPDLCEDLAVTLLGGLHRDGDGYRRIYRSNVRAFTETIGDRAARETYLANSARIMAALRQTCQPAMSPIDRLRCELDEIWPGGATLLRTNGQPLVFGMCRVWDDDAEALPHMDILRNVASGIPETRIFTEQLGANIYLRMPPGGAGDGAVELWDAGMADSDQERHGIPGTYGYRRELLGDPTVVVRPSAGDLLLLRSTRIHAVRPTSAGLRVTLSGFVGHVSDHEPLRLWS